ncbi:aldo/keto reductase [Oceanobacillus manasiensis]|uniref:aldo/keto reductase n=1 Tax=Oceanobacillus manasiensis TaxID=586413 RepID=UPI0005A60504|nr:aldo/keto reductase [Oceanobacillus manasiensis]
MKQNQLGKSGISISPLTLGCMSLGTDLNQAKNMIDIAIDRGITHLDTADLYDFGTNEEIVGKAIKGKRDQVVLTTKVGNHFNKKTEDWYWDPSAKHITEGVKDSLRRLQTDYIDFYMLHGGTIDDPIDESIEAFERLKDEGYIRSYGISSIRPNVIREYVKRSTIDAVMMQYSILDRRPEEEVLDLLHANGISVLARGPLAKGMLSNQAKHKIEEKGQEGYLNHSYNDLQNYYNTLANISSEEGMQEIALQYVLKHPAVASAVFGASSVGQVKANTSLSLDELANDTYLEIQQSIKPIQYVNHR